jgi:hypothetical protein
LFSSDCEKTDGTISEVQAEQTYLITPIGKTYKYKYHLLTCKYT